MPKTEATDVAMYYAATKNSETLDAGVVSPGDIVATGNDKTLIANSDENTFLGGASGNAGNYNPLPDTGEQIEAGEIYSYNNELVIARQSHQRTNDAPGDVPALFLTYRANASGAVVWVQNEWVEVGIQRDYEGTTYQAIQAHTTLLSNAPGLTVGVLWSVVTDSAEWQVGVVYSVGDVVTYQGTEYECIQAHTSIVTWQPPNVPALWAEQV